MIKCFALLLFFATLPYSATQLAFAQIKVGVGAPLTGDFGPTGKEIVNGVKLAIDDINARGGLLGQQLQMIVGDDHNNRASGLEVANQFVAGGVKFVVGHHNSDVSVFTAQIYAANGILMIAPDSTNPLLTDQGLWNVDRVIGRDDQQGKFAADFIASKFAGKSVLLVHDETPYGSLIFRAAKAEFAVKKANKVIEANVDGNSFDAAQLGSEVKRKKFDVVYWAGMPHGLARLLTEGGLPADLSLVMGPDSLGLKEFAKAAGAAADGVVLTVVGDPRQRSDAEDVNKEFAARNVVPTGYTLYAYAAVQVIAEAAEAAKSLNPKVVGATLRSGRSFPTVLGALQFDAKGDRKDLDYTLFKMKSFGSSSEFLPYAPN